jgi:hypothetical protein
VLCKFRMLPGIYSPLEKNASTIFKVRQEVGLKVHVGDLFTTKVLYGDLLIDFHCCFHRLFCCKESITDILKIVTRNFHLYLEA